MSASKKMKTFGMKVLAEKVGKDLSVVYRWHKALENGVGIRDANKRALIAATAEGPDPICWADFSPPMAQAA